MHQWLGDELGESTAFWCHKKRYKRLNETEAFDWKSANDGNLFRLLGAPFGLNLDF
jgi:hypothetical protein